MAKIGPILLLTVALLGGTPTSPASAAFPGLNGKIAFRSDDNGNNEIYRMNADGSNQINLTTDSASDVDPMCPPMAPGSCSVPIATATARSM